MKKKLNGNICQFPLHKYSHHCLFHVNNDTLPNKELGRNKHVILYHFYSTGAIDILINYLRSRDSSKI